MPHDQSTLSARLERMEKKMDQVVTACVGSEDGSIRGYNTRLEIIERFKRAAIKALWIVYVAVIGMFFAFLKSLPK